tara:strand:+ start:353 stop:739 length:387 start_codon:yes stop_codon:yes gene_type:complete
VWFSQLGFPHITLEFPYKRQSPLTKKVKTYDSIIQVWEEIEILVDEWKDSQFSLGRNLYFHLPLFMNPQWIIDIEYQMLLKEYSIIKEFNIPLANTIEEASARKLDEFDVISREIKSIQLYMDEKNGR